MTNETGKKKGLPPLAWVGIGCGGLLLVMIVGVSLLVGMCSRNVERFSADISNPETAAATVAEMAVKMNPDLELVKSDRAAGTITIRDQRTGKESTVTYEALAEGRLTVETAEGTTTIGPGGDATLPEWFEAPAEVTNWQSIMRQESGEKLSGILAGKTAMEAGAAAGAFEEKLAAAGFERTMRTEAGNAIVIRYEKAGPPRQVVNVNCVPEDGKTAVQLTYTQE